MKKAEVYQLRKLCELIESEGEVPKRLLADCRVIIERELTIKQRAAMRQAMFFQHVEASKAADVAIDSTAIHKQITREIHAHEDWLAKQQRGE